VLHILNINWFIFPRLIVLLLLFNILFTLHSEEVSAPVYLVADASNGTILVEKGGDVPVSPASLAKLMTLHLSLKDVDSGRLSENCLYAIPPGGVASSMRQGSSILGLSSGDESSIITLQRAAAMVSANDAAWTLALLSERDVQSFVARMNRTAEEIGMVDTIYTDPDGWSSLSTTTGRDQMCLALYYIKNHPGILNRIHSLPRMVYQDSDNIKNKKTRKNTNLLLGRVAGVDGLKTGTIPSAGFHFIATAQRDSTRFIAVVMGIRTSSYFDSLNRRAEDAELLLEWAFKNYYSWRPSFSDKIVSPVRHGGEEQVGLAVFPEDLILVEPITLPQSDSRVLTVLYDIPGVLTAPLEAGEKAGYIRWYFGSELLAEVPLRTCNSVLRHWRIKDIF